MTAFPLIASGKVRELYAVDDDTVLIVASDRISAYDVVLPTPIPDKVRILTGLSLWWFDQLRDLVPNHLLSTDDERIPAEWRGRAMVCRRLDMVPIECVARGYLTGSGLKDYEATGQVSGIRLHGGLVDGDRLPRTIFTPATKAATGEHDENISAADVAASLGADVAAELERLTLAVFARAGEIAHGRGIILADTKLEFGYDREGVLRLGDEVLAPDSSRFWPADVWRPGRPQPSYDKQYVRDWLRAHWDGSGDPPPLPNDVVAQTRERYVEAYERLTGRSFADYLAAATA